MIVAPLQPVSPTPIAPAAAATLACAMDLHLGPYEPLPELAGWLGGDWCRCRRCGSAVTRRTTVRNAA